MLVWPTDGLCASFMRVLAGAISNRGMVFMLPCRATCLQKVTTLRSKFWNSGTLKKSCGGGQKPGRGVGARHIICLGRNRSGWSRRPGQLLVIRVAGSLVLQNSRRSWLAVPTLVREYLGKCGINAVVNVPSRWPPYVPDRTYRCPWRRQWCCQSASRRRVLHRRRNNPATWPKAALYSGRV